MLINPGAAQKCENWDDALKQARKLAGCDPDSTSSKCSNPDNNCQQAIADCGATCDICAILAEGRGPPVDFSEKQLKDPDTGKPARGLTTCEQPMDFFDAKTKKTFRVPGQTRSVDFMAYLCKGKEMTGLLASVILHEALHACSACKIDDKEGKCQAASITKKCGYR